MHQDLGNIEDWHQWPDWSFEQSSYCNSLALVYPHDQSSGPGGVHLMAHAAPEHVDTCGAHNLL